MSDLIMILCHEHFASEHLEFSSVLVRTLISYHYYVFLESHRHFISYSHAAFQWLDIEEI